MPTELASDDVDCSMVVVALRVFRFVGRFVQFFCCNLWSKEGSLRGRHLDVDVVGHAKLAG